MSTQKKILILLVLALVLVALFSAAVSVNACDCPGTVTPGWLKRHPEAWGSGAVWEELKLHFGLPDAHGPEMVETWLKQVPGDKWYTLFRATFAAKFNFINGCYCDDVSETLGAAIWWLGKYAHDKPVKANSPAWKQAEPLYFVLDDYNNGELCFPHRD